MTTTTTNEILHRAIQLLAGVCDGAIQKDDQGFNAPDSPEGHYLAHIPLDAWTPHMLTRAYQLARTYHRQLAGWGIDVNLLPIPLGAGEDDVFDDDALPEQPERAHHRARRLATTRANHVERTISIADDGTVVLYFPKNPSISEALKATVVGAGFMYEPTPHWTVPPIVGNGAALRTFAAEHGFILGDCVVAHFDAMDRGNFAKALRRITWLSDTNRTTLMVEFPKGDAPYEDVRNLPKREFLYAPAPHWRVPLRADNAVALLRIIEIHQFQADDVIIAALRERADQAQPSYRVETTDEGVRVFFPKGANVYHAVKAMGAQFVGDVPDDQKHWFVRNDPAMLAALCDLLDTQRFHGADTVRRAINERIATAAALIHASRQTDTDFMVDGLGRAPYPFQRAGIKYAVDAKRCFLADQQGLGKTPQSLATVHALTAYPALVICPASLKLNWAHEAAAWLPGKRIAVIGTASKRVTALYAANNIHIIQQLIPTDTYDIVVINYDLLQRYQDALTAYPFKSIVADECHYLKEKKAQRTQAALVLADGKTVRLGLSGTPLVNRPIELATQLEFLGRLSEFGGFFKFALRYCNAQQKDIGRRMVWDFSGASNLDELNATLRSTCYIRRLKSDVLSELPTKQRAVVPITITNVAEYERAERDVLAYLKAEAAAEQAFRASISQLPPHEQQAQIAARQGSVNSGAEHLQRIGVLRQLVAKGKVDAAKDWIATFLESGEKLVVFAYHQEIQQALLDAFPDAVTILGGENPTVVEDNKARFQTDPDCHLLIASMTAAREGHTLTAASNVCFIELGWTPTLQDQCEDRCHRIGQENQVTAWYLLAPGTIDDDMHALIKQKRAIVDAATDGALDDVGDALGPTSVFPDLVARLRNRVTSDV